MARKRNKTPELTREQKLTVMVDQILKSEHITPMQIYDLILMGHQVYKPGMGIPQAHVWESILQGFKQNGRMYLNPYTMAVLVGRDSPEDSDFDELCT